MNELSAEWPDIIIAVDFGMTCTGVASINIQQGSERPAVLQRWPGRADRAESKVPTTLVYSNPQGTLLQGKPLGFGFKSEAIFEEKGEGVEIRELFKTLLNEKELQERQRHFPREAPQSMAEVEKCFEDYLRLVRERIEDELEEKLSSSWNESKIEYLFSLPTTWTDKIIVEKFRNIITRAGYGNRPNQKLTIGLTEAEAAAVHTAKEQSALYQEGDVILVCDAGGGTTDLAVLKLQSKMRRVLDLRQLAVVQGRTIGSAQIDQHFYHLVYERLRQASQSRPFVPSDQQLMNIAWDVIRSKRYQNNKCDFGTVDTQDIQIFPIPASGIPDNYVNQEFGISGRKMNFSRNDFEFVFDNQIHRLCELIDSQISQLQKSHPNERITHLILSGGLGNSKYVQQKLRARYASSEAQGVGSGFFAPMRMQVADNPQLAVSLGILEDRYQKLSTGHSILGWRCCRESYGVACKELYDDKNPEHMYRTKETDPTDGKIYVTDGIDWLIKVGEPVNEDNPKTHTFSRTIPFDNPKRQFGSYIYVSRLMDSKFLPGYIKGKEVQRVCMVTSDLNRFGLDEFERKKSRSFSWKNVTKKRDYYVVRYEIKAIVGPADLRFELWFNGNKVSHDNAIRVEWFPTEAPEVGPDRASMDAPGIRVPEKYGF